jgi:hypothetical protein
MISAKLANRFCLVCDQRLAEVSKAMRRHESIMAQGALWLRMDEVTEERRQDFRARIIASFTEAQMAWDAYRDHLKEHGLLPFFRVAASTHVRTARIRTPHPVTHHKISFT